jgi:hypothetical protein
MVSLMDAAYLAIGFVVFVVSVAVGASVLAGIQTGQLNSSGGATAASNVSGYGITGMTNIGSQAGVIGTILAAVVIIGLLMSAFVVNRR